MGIVAIWNIVTAWRWACCTLTVMCRLAAVLLILSIGQPTVSEPRRFGSLGERLTDSEIGEVGEIAKSAGGRPWLVVGHRSMALGVAGLDVYLQPDAKGGQVSRGRLLRLMADDPPTVPQRSAWRVRDTKMFAYIGGPGRPPFEILNEQDLTWPFAVEGEIDDATLMSLVAFVRSTPRIPGVPAGSIPGLVAAAPISVIARRDATMFVGLRTSAYTGQNVTVVRENGKWRITKVSQWIV